MSGSESIKEEIKQLEQRRRGLIGEIGFYTASITAMIAYMAWVLMEGFTLNSPSLSWLIWPLLITMCGFSLFIASLNLFRLLREFRALRERHRFLSYLAKLPDINSDLEHRVDSSHGDIETTIPDGVKKITVKKISDDGNKVIVCADKEEIIEQK